MEISWACRGINTWCTTITGHRSEGSLVWSVTAPKTQRSGSADKVKFSGGPALTCAAIGFQHHKHGSHTLKHSSVHPLESRHHEIFVPVASSLFHLHVWQSFSTSSLQVLFGLPLGLELSTSYSIHFFTQIQTKQFYYTVILSISSVRWNCLNAYITRGSSIAEIFHAPRSDCGSGSETRSESGLD